MAGVTLDAVVSTQPVEHAFGARQWCRDTASVPWSRIDGVLIASAAHSHYQLACEGIQRGIPVLVEKPLATSAFEARCISKLARKHDVLVMVALVHVFSEAFTVLRQRLARQRIQTIRGWPGTQVLTDAIAMRCGLMDRTTLA
jgi:predicted dehydrogenase